MMSLVEPFLERRVDPFLERWGLSRPGHAHHDETLRENLKTLLDQEDRRQVEFSFSLRTARRVEEGIQVHLVLVFRYRDDMIKDIMCADRPLEDEIHERGTWRRIFPYCIFNSVEEEPLSWTFHRTGQAPDEMVEENIELSVVLTFVSHRQYFPFVLELLPIKIGSDGTGKTKLINLTPKMKDISGGRQIPDAGFDVFTKSTSPFSIGRDSQEGTADHVMCRMCVRDLGEASRTREGIITRVYIAFFFESSSFGNLVRFILIPSFILQLNTFLPKMEIGDMVQMLLGMVLADVALLFVLPASNEMSMAEQIIVMHICYSLLVGCVVGFLTDHRFIEPDDSSNHEWVLVANFIVTLLTVLRALVGYRQFRRLDASIRHKLKPILPERNVASFERIEQEI